MLGSLLVAAVLAHNGVVHRPLESSAMLVGPSLADNIPYVVFNYGMNYVRGFAFNPTWFPVAAVALTPTTVFTVSDTESGFRYALNTKLIDPPGECPAAQVSKFVASPGGAASTVSLFMLRTGQVYTVAFVNDAIKCTRAQPKGWPDAIDWHSPWGPDFTNTENPLFFSYAFWNDCNWYMRPYAAALVKVVSKCPLPANNVETANLADGYFDSQLIHGGGELFVFRDQLYVVNGETSSKNADSLARAVNSRASDDDYLAGKILKINADGSTAIASRGFRHPWSAVVRTDGVYVADVGHATCEEISKFTGERANFGWPLFEGKTVHYPFATVSERDDPFVFPVVDHCRYSGDVLGLNKTWDASLMVLLALAVGVVGLSASAYGSSGAAQNKTALLPRALWVVAIALLLYPFFFHRTGADPSTILRHRSSVAIVYLVTTCATLSVPLYLIDPYPVAAPLAAGTLLVALLIAARWTFPYVWVLAAAPYLGLAVAAGAFAYSFYAMLYAAPQKTLGKSFDFYF